MLACSMSPRFATMLCTIPSLSVALEVMSCRPSRRVVIDVPLKLSERTFMPISASSSAASSIGTSVSAERTLNNATSCSSDTLDQRCVDVDRTLGEADGRAVVAPHHNAPSAAGKSWVQASPANTGSKSEARSPGTIGFCFQIANISDLSQ